MVRFTAPVDNTGDLVVYWFVDGKTGTPNAFGAGVYPEHATDADRRATDTNEVSDLMTGQDWSAGGDLSWQSITITNCVLTAGDSYWIGIYNLHATAVSNYFDIFTRGSFDCALGGQSYFLMQSLEDEDGWPATADPLSRTWVLPVCMKFDDGSVMGNPFVVGAAPASSTNWRGQRIKVFANSVVSGFEWGGALTSALNSGLMAIYPSDSGTALVSATIGLSAGQQTSHRRFAPVTLLANSLYDLVIKPASAHTVWPYAGMGTSPPADVAACQREGWGTVNGATPGSFTFNAERIREFGLVFDRCESIYRPIQRT